MKKLLIIGVLMLIAVALVAEEVPGERYRINDDTYSEWVSMSEVEKTSYVWGVLTGAYAMASDLNWRTDSTHATDYVEGTLPSDWTVGDYIDTINYVYEAPPMRDAPIWTIMFRLREAVKVREEYGNKYE
jgi:hypothetical protein